METAMHGAIYFCYDKNECTLDEFFKIEKLGVFRAFLHKHVLFKPMKSNCVITHNDVIHLIGIN